MESILIHFKAKTGLAWGREIKERETRLRNKENRPDLRIGSPGGVGFLNALGSGCFKVLGGIHTPEK